jgi:hypothetical protein
VFVLTFLLSLSFSFSVFFFFFLLLFIIPLFSIILYNIKERMFHDCFFESCFFAYQLFCSHTSNEMIDSNNENIRISYSNNAKVKQPFINKSLYAHFYDEFTATTSPWDLWYIPAPAEYLAKSQPTGLNLKAGTCDWPQNWTLHRKRL